MLPRKERSYTKHRDAASPLDVTYTGVKCSDNNVKALSKNQNSVETMAGLPAVARLLIILRDAILTQYINVNKTVQQGYRSNFFKYTSKNIQIAKSIPQ